MDILSVSPLRVGGLLWRRSPTKVILTLVVKGTFTLKPGKVTLAPEQEDLNERENHWDDDPGRSVYAPSDMAPLKRRGDVVLVGSAFAPNGEPVRSLVARLVVGAVDKSITVHGPRVFMRDGELRHGPLWDRMPLRYERAAGGMATWNPVGIAMDAPPDGYGQRALPNLQAPDQAVTGRSDFIRPTGFGPIAAGWTLRREILRQHADTFDEAMLDRVPLADDLDPLYFQAAPPDQQVDALRDDEPITLENLHPEHPVFTTQLSGTRPRVFLDRGAAAPTDVTMSPDTLWIDTARAICTVTWRAQVPLSESDQTGRVVIGAEMPGQKLSWRVVSALLEAANAEPAGAKAGVREETRTLRVMPKPALPFVAQAASGERSPVSMPSPPQERARHRGPRATVTLVLPESPANVLPWEAHPHAASPPTVMRTAPPAEPEPGLPRPPALLAGSTSPPVVSGDAAILREAHLQNAAMVGAVAASNAAADRPRPSSAPVATVTEHGAIEPTPLELLWFDPAFHGEVRRVATWTPLFSPRARKPPPARGAPPPAPDPPGGAEENARADFSAVLARGASVSEADLDSAMTGALGRMDRAPLCLVSGTIELVFDEIELLQATVAAASRLAATDKKLKEVLDRVGEVSAVELRSAPDVVDGLVRQVRDAWAKANRLLPANHLETQPARVLLEQRHYQKRELLDGSWIRALFVLVGADAPLPAYLPATLAKRLPLYRRFQARAVVAVVPQQDPYEDCGLALRVVALARVIAPSPRDRGPVQR